MTFRQITHDIRTSIQDCNAGTDDSVIPIQGSGTFAIEGVLTTFIKDSEKVLVCANGVYGETAAKILHRHMIRHKVLSWPINKAVDVAEVEATLEANPDITTFISSIAKRHPASKTRCLTFLDLLGAAA